jgi:glycosyltransferase involved in cell wall biosynthesis
MFKPALPKISVCIPTFNGAPTIRETIESVLLQTWADFELIVCDDSSSDSTLEIVQLFNDQRIKIVKNLKIGSVADNWNHAMSHCQSDLIKIMGQDDLLYPKCLQIELALFEKFAKSNPSFIYSNRDIVFQNGTKLFKPQTGKKTGARLRQSELLLRNVVRSGRNPIGEPVSVTMRRSCFLKTNGFEGSYVIDLDMWFKLLQLGPAIENKTILSAFRVSRRSWSFKLRKDQAKETLELFHETAFLNQKISKFDLHLGKFLAYSVQYLRMLVIYTFDITASLRRKKNYEH